MTWRGDWQHEGYAQFAGVRARRVIDHVDLATGGETIARGGFWVVVATFEGRLDAWRMADVERHDQVSLASGPAQDGAHHEADAPGWAGPAAAAWESSLSRDGYMAGVNQMREYIREGGVYQVNLCRMLEAPLAALEPGPDPYPLAHRLEVGNPARFAASIVIPEGTWPGAWVVSASPELYLEIDGHTVSSSPIKGTAAPGEHMLPKDHAENVMITDLVRNDLSHVALPGSVSVPEFLGLHELPGLVHLQSTVRATLREECAWTPSMWPALLDGTFPPGSVSGAPKSSALRIIGEWEPVARGPYCGAVGWIDADARRARLAVGIRTFVWTPDRGGILKFGTGAGITWGSDAAAEWEETELKARRLIALASTTTMAP